MNNTPPFPHCIISKSCCLYASKYHKCSNSYYLFSGPVQLPLTVPSPLASFYTSSHIHWPTTSNIFKIELEFQAYLPDSACLLPFWPISCHSSPIHSEISLLIFLPFFKCSKFTPHDTLGLTVASVCHTQSLNPSITETSHESLSV